jgi:hypothetical protein
VATHRPLNSTNSAQKPIFEVGEGAQLVVPPQPFLVLFRPRRCHKPLGFSNKSGVSLCFLICFLGCPGFQKPGPGRRVAHHFKYHAEPKSIRMSF